MSKLSNLSSILIYSMFLFPLACFADLPWLPWSESHFQTAQKEKKLVLLNLEAVWCHWCHVMEEKTYSDPEIKNLLTQNFILLKVDQDSRPDLSNRYKEYGWPATIILSASGEDLRKLSGFVEPERMREILKAVIKDPSPKEEKDSHTEQYLSEASLSEATREKLRANQYSSFDFEKGGLKIAQRYLDPDSVEYSLMQAAATFPQDSKDAQMAKLTLLANQKLFDPAWGGVYQYSTHFGWDKPHYEKIVSTQANNLRIYSLAHLLWRQEKDLTQAKEVYRYIRDFLTSPEGVFYTSQDADLKKGEKGTDYFSLSDKERRALGIPVIDKNIYSRENGMLIYALTYLNAASGDEELLSTIKKSANWILVNRALAGGGFSHSAKDPQGSPYLGDTLYMGQALLGLYAVTGERVYLDKAQAALEFIENNFRDYDKTKNRPGYFTSYTGKVGVLLPVRKLNENIDLARFANLLFHYTGDPSYKNFAEHALRYIGTPELALSSLVESGVLLADQEISSAPLHITIVGSKADPDAKKLFKAGLQEFSTYKRLEWWDKKEGAMPNPDVDYPAFPKAAAFICTNKRCSLPIFKPEGIGEAVKKLKAS